MHRATQLWSQILLLLPLAVSWYDVTAASTNEINPTCDFKETDVQYFDIKISNTRVPTDLTTYVCQKLSIPVGFSQDFHAIGFLPLVSNPEVVHHMILFGCPDRGHQSVHRCTSQDNRCRQFLVQWSRGMDGAICNYPAAGNRFGLTSVKSMSLQIHWNNQKGADRMQVVNLSSQRTFSLSVRRERQVA